MEKLSWRIMLLIEPFGIETGDGKVLRQVKLTFNRTFWN